MFQMARTRPTWPRIFCLFLFALLFHSLLTLLTAPSSSQEAEASELINAFDPKEFKCGPCQYMKQHRFPDSQTITVTTMHGIGRTGNYFKAIRLAMVRAHECKTALKLPATDDKGEVLEPTESTRYFDFTNRPGPVHPSCVNSTVGAGLKGDSGLFYYLAPLSSTTKEELEFHQTYDNEEPVIRDCLRWYMGACTEEFCKVPSQAYHNSLVVHIRQGDIFMANFTKNPKAPRQGQQPLSFYLSAMNHRKWDKVVFVAQWTETEFNPVFLAFQVLQAFNSTKIPIEFYQSNHFKEDLRVLFCAKNLVPSWSSLRYLLTNGFSRRYYIKEWCRFVPHYQEREIFRIKIADGYSFERHDNSPREWVDMLLTQSYTPELCP